MAARRIRLPEERHASERMALTELGETFQDINCDHDESGKPFSQGERATLTDLRKLAKALETAQRARLQRRLPEPTAEDQRDGATARFVVGVIPEPATDEND